MSPYLPPRTFHLARLVSYAMLAFLFLRAGHLRAEGELPRDTAFFPLDYRNQGPALAGQFLNLQGNENLDAKTQRNYPVWTMKTEDGHDVPSSAAGLLPSDGRAIQFGLSHGFIFRAVEERGPNLAAEKFAIFARIYYRSGGDFRISQPGAMEIRWFSDKSIDPPREQVAITLYVDGKKETLWQSIEETAQWHNFLIARNGQALQCYIDGVLTQEKVLKNGAVDKPTGPLQIENLSRQPQYLESMAIFPSGVEPELAERLTH